MGHSPDRINQLRAMLARRGSEQHLYLSALPIEQRLPDLFGAIRAVLDEVETWANAEIGQEECVRLVLHAIATALEDPDSRVLFGRVLPEHIMTEWHHKWTELACSGPHEGGGGPWKTLVYHTGTYLELDGLDRFLARHKQCGRSDPLK